MVLINIYIILVDVLHLLQFILSLGIPIIFLLFVSHELLVVMVSLHHSLDRTVPLLHHLPSHVLCHDALG